MLKQAWPKRIEAVPISTWSGVGGRLGVGVRARVRGGVRARVGVRVGVRAWVGGGLG